jgi:site-specific recombinase XerD
MSRLCSVGRAWGPTTTRTRRTPLPDAADAAAAEATAGFGQPVITPEAATPNLPQPLGPVSSASVAELRRLAGDAIPGPKSTLEKRRRSVRLFAEHLEQFPGETWQQRWLASGWEQPDRLLRLLNPPRAHAWSMTLGFKWLAAMRAIVPSVAAMRRQGGPDYAGLFRMLQADPLLNEVFTRITGADSSRRYRVVSQTQLAIALTSQAIPMADLGPAALLWFACEWRRGVPGGRTDAQLGGLLAWQVLARMGHFPPGTPDSLRRAMLGGRRDVAELVDRYGVRNGEVRQLLIDYLNHRIVAGMDYPTTDKLSRDLVRNFWMVIESINPEQADLNLDEATYQAWRARIDVVDTADGPRPRAALHMLLMHVRAFYLDLQSWAPEAPQRWARWVARCPIPATATRSYQRSRRRQMERMADRTRLRQPLLPLLVEHVVNRWEHERGLAARAEAAAPGEWFEFAGAAYRRKQISEAHRQARETRGYHRLPTGIVDEGTGATIHVHAAAERAFWDWAVVEVLRLTGIRHEELLELTHLSVRQFQRPNGEIVALLVIAPSKTDRERVIPMSAELFHVIAEIIRYHTRDGRPIPLLRRWDGHEREHSPLLPFLLQHQHGTFRSVFSTTWVLNTLRRVCADLAATHPEFAGIRFTPHDFRRIFATELVNNGLPIHIGAALLGHTSLQTTRGYVAVFDDDVVRHYQQFLDHRRQLRPAEEYRPATDQEWAEFEEHFDKRKVELGGCARPYGTPCSHEHVPLTEIVWDVLGSSRGQPGSDSAACRSAGWASAVTACGGVDLVSSRAVDHGGPRRFEWPSTALRSGMSRGWRWPGSAGWRRPTTG